MKWILWLILFVSSILSIGCHSKQRIKKPIEESVNIDTVYNSPMVQVAEERGGYDSISRKRFMFRNLSRQFDIELNVIRFIEKDDVHDSCIVNASLMDKRSKKILDSVLVTSVFFYTNYYDNAGHAVSYSTGIHVFNEPVDNYAGDLIVADLNFDGKDDLALINDMGGNGGPFYRYFVQQSNHKFILDRYLTDSMIYFPKIDRRKKTLTTYVHAGACCVGKHVYKFDINKQEWKQVDHIILGLPKQPSKS